jgi:1-deoxy-D-xylulose-5-phosphate reductoisomerase
LPEGLLGLGLNGSANPIKIILKIMKKQICILGSTGSIGTQALDVISQHSDLYEAYCLTANNRVKELAAQARKYHPAAVVIANEERYDELKDLLADQPDIKVYAGKEALDQIVEADPIDMVLTAMVGFAGLSPTIHAIKAHKKICLANKETLVVAGELICQLAQQYHAPILPVDSEHSAIFQSIVGEDDNPIEKILLTASGGPFRLFSHEQIEKVTVADALKHPTWEMGAKITIDSASMMNKGFEVMEAKWLFGVDADKIQVLVHPQSIVHSAVQFHDGAVKAQLGVPDMRLPIQYAFSFPKRLPLNGERLDLFKHPLEFFEPDLKKFRCLALAFEAIKRGGNMPCIVNAANEIVNEGFRHGKCSFLGMADIIEQTMDKATFDAKPTYETYVQTDAEARAIAQEIMNK